MEFSRTAASGLLVCLTLLLGSCASGVPDRAWAEIDGIEGARVGSAIIEKTGDGVKVLLEVNGLPEGRYGFRFHSFGECDSPAFINAGRPFPGEPEAASHTEEPNYVGTFAVQGPGVVEAEATVSNLALDGSEHSLFHPGGTSIVVHTIPSGPGDSSQRIACGVVVPYGEAHADAESLPEGALDSAITPENMGEGDKNYRRPKADPAKP